MAQEIQISASLVAQKNGALLAMPATVKLLDMSADDLLGSVQSVGTSAETLNLGEISGAPTVIKLTNLDATNYVEIGGDSGLTVFKLKIPAGSCALFAPTAVPIYAKANTSACLVLIEAAK